MSNKTSSKQINTTANHPLQTAEWAEFRREWGNEVVETKFGLVTIHKMPFLPYKLGLFEKGPMPTKSLLEDLQRLAKQHRLFCIKMEPNYPINKDGMKCADKEKAVSLLKTSGAIRGKTLFTPTTFWLDLTKSEDELMASFTGKTRYNIRLAQKKGVTIVEDNSHKAFEEFLRLTRETVERQRFYAHSERYLRLMWKHLHQKPTANGQKPLARLLVAKYTGKVITTWVVFVWKDFLYYPYGASTHNPKYRNLMANNLMMWEAIRYGKKLGLTTFDLWGREEGKGFTKFKEGYNPQVIEFLGTWDLIINKPLYWLYRTAEAIRWPLLRLKGKIVKPNF